MKDKQPLAKTPTGSVPVVSPVLHCLAMPVLVFLRHSFGYAFLSPKAVFLATVFATGVFSYIVWHDEAFRPRFSALTAFASIASALYLVHLISAIIKQARGNAEHDQYSGRSYLIGFPVPVKQEKREGFIHCILEPALIITAGILASPDLLGKVLVVCGVALGFKELIRAWLSIRLRKRLSDNLGDATETIETAQPTSQSSPLPTLGRTGRERHPRKFEPEEAGEESGKEDYPHR
jgi:hypothetical protein